MPSTTRTHMRRSTLLRICALGTVALTLAACGASGQNASPRPALAHVRWRVLPAAPVRVDAYLTTAWTGSELIVSGVCCTENDGTLLRADGTVSDRTIQALRDVAAAGIVLALVTARPPDRPTVSIHSSPLHTSGSRP